jgi:hypothetical protein
MSRTRSLTQPQAAILISQRPCEVAWVSGATSQCIHGGSPDVIAPQLTVSGRLELRTIQVVGEQGEQTDRPKVRTLVADSVTVTESRFE